MDYSQIDTKKTEEELRQEIIDEFSFDYDDERIEKILEIRKDRYDATQQKKKAQTEAEELRIKLQEAEEKGEPNTPQGEPKGQGKEPPTNEGNQKGGEPKGILTIDDRAWLYSQGWQRSQLPLIEKVMSFNNQTAEEAIKDPLCEVLMERFSADERKRQGALPASKGGSAPVSKTDEDAEVDKAAENYSKRLPPGFTYDPNR